MPARRETEVTPRQLNGSDPTSASHTICDPSEHYKRSPNVGLMLGQRLQGWKTMENGKIKSRPGKVMKNDNLARSHGKRILIFHKYLSHFFLEKCVDYVHFCHTMTLTVHLAVKYFTCEK